MRKRQYKPQNVTKALGLRIRNLRNAKGWTLEECEEHSDLNWKYLQAIESGQNVTVHTLVKIANLFGISLADLLDEI